MRVWCTRSRHRRPREDHGRKRLLLISRATALPGKIRPVYWSRTPMAFFMAARPEALAIMGPSTAKCIFAAALRFRPSLDTNGAVQLCPAARPSGYRQGQHGRALWHYHLARGRSSVVLRSASAFWRRVERDHIVRSPLRRRPGRIGDGPRRGALCSTTLGGETTDGNCNPGGCGVVFALTPPASPAGAWTQTVLHTFTSNPDGAFPNPLTAGPDGVLSGSTYSGGTVFAFRP
jgi:hypothetical protein